VLSRQRRRVSLTRSIVALMPDNENSRGIAVGGGNIARFPAAAARPPAPLVRAETRLF